MTAVLDGNAGTCGDRGHEGQMGGPAENPKHVEMLPGENEI